MVLPLYLAMTAAEMSAAGAVPEKAAWMACHFSPYSEGITNIPDTLPRGAMLILNDRMPCQGHSPGLVVQQLTRAVEQLGSESVLLDFQRSSEPEAGAMVKAIVKALPCPVGVSNGCAGELDCPVFLSPAPLHVPLAQYLSPWQGREIWLEAALCQEAITVTAKGSDFAPHFPPEGLEGGFYDEALCCNYVTKIRKNEVNFTLFDTLDSLQKKLALAQSLGVTRAVGLWQELGR